MIDLKPVPSPRRRQERVRRDPPAPEENGREVADFASASAGDHCSRRGRGFRPPTLSRVREEQRLGRATCCPRNCVKAGSRGSGHRLAIKAPMPFPAKSPLLILRSAIASAQAVRLRWQRACFMKVGRPLTAAITFRGDLHHHPALLLAGALSLGTCAVRTPMATRSISITPRIAAVPILSPQQPQITVTE